VLNSFPPDLTEDSDVAFVYSVLDQTEKAFEYLDRALKTKGANLGMIKVDHRFRKIQSDPRFDEILENLNLK
jgi:hypothetical protein